jgi:hypothetical protein
MIIKFHQYTKYRKELSEIVNQLFDMSDQIYSDMVNLATLGKWQKWSNEQPAGTVFEFTEDMLRDTGDKNVDALVELMDKILDTKDVLSSYQKEKKKKAESLEVVEEIPLWDFPEGALD